jgi:hypothetical protein
VFVILRDRNLIQRKLADAVSISPHPGSAYLPVRHHRRLPNRIVELLTAHLFHSMAAALLARRAIELRKARYAMKNPWTRKNPFMSMWLSGANAVAGSARSRALAESRRQTAALMTQSAQQITDFWTGALLTPPKRKNKKQRQS